MTDRYHPALEAWVMGEIPFEALPAEMQHDEEVLRAFLQEVESPARAPAHLRASIMEEIAATQPAWAIHGGSQPRSWWSRGLAWLSTPRTIQVTPLTAMAGTLAAAALVLLVGRGNDSPTGGDVPLAPEAVATASQSVVTRFVFAAPDARSVTLTGDWLHWRTDEVVLRQVDDSGLWTADVPVPPGVHEYSFVVDGMEWHPDPLASAQTDDGFGRVNSVLLVSGAEV